MRVTNEEIRTKNRDHGDYKRPSGEEKMDMAWPCPQNGFSTIPAPAYCPHLGSRREEEAGSTARDMEKDNGMEAYGQGIKNMGRGSVSSKGWNSLEGENMRPNFTLGDKQKLMLMML